MPESTPYPLAFKPTDTELKDILRSRAAGAVQHGRYLLGAALLTAINELEMAEAFADAVESAETAWNSRTTAVPLIRPPMRPEHPRKAQQDEFPCIHGYKTYTDGAGRVHIATGGRCEPDVRTPEGEPNGIHQHTTCIDVTPPNRPPRSEWVCGPDCPPAPH
jgi:hypothetical protein